MNKSELIKGTVIEVTGLPGAPKVDHLIAGIRRNSAENDLCTEIALISLGVKREMPFNVIWADFEARILNGTYTLTTKSPELIAVRSLENVPDRRRKKFERIRATNKARIQPILDLGWGAFDSTSRGAELAAVAAGKRGTQSCSPTWLRDLLITYWRTGENDLALAPDYTACGAPTRAELRILHAASKGEVKQPRRCGPKIKYHPIGENGVEPISGLDEPGRGGCAIPFAAEPVIEGLIDSYLKAPENRAYIKASLKRWNGLPWKDIKKSVRRGLRDYPPYATLQPSRRQVAYIGRKSVDLLKTLSLVHGPRHSNLNHRALTGDYRDVSKFAGMRYEIDITQTDIHLVDDITGYNIGRVFVIFVIDRFTGLIAGIYVTTDNVDYSHVARALHCAFSNKVEWCKTVGLEIAPGDWPAEGRCEEVVADNAQLASKDGVQVAEHMVDIGLARPYRGDDKPAVESAFERVEFDFVHRFNFGVSKGPKERATDDPGKSSCISVGTFTRELARWVIKTFNHRPYPSSRFLEPAFLKLRKNTSPFEYWKWSVAKLGGPLKKYDPAMMMPRLLKRIEANMTEMGIEIEGLYFDRPDDADFKSRSV